MDNNDACLLKKGVLSMAYNMGFELRGNNEDVEAPVFVSKDVFDAIECLSWEDAHRVLTFYTRGWREALVYCT